MINYKSVINETNYEFSFNQERTFKYDLKGSMKVEIYDVLINGEKSIYCVHFDTQSNSYYVWSGILDKKGGITHRRLNDSGIKGESGFPIDVVYEVVKLINK